MEREHAFSDSDVRLLQTLAGSMSVALENARLFDETQRRTRETAALAEVGRDISSTLDLATVMDRIAAPRQGAARRRQQRHLPARRRRAALPRHRRGGRDRSRRIKRHRGHGRPGHHRQHRRRAAAPSSSTTPSADPRASRSPGTPQADGRAPDGGAAAWRARRSRARWRCGATAGGPSTTPSSSSWCGLSLPGGGGDRERAPLRRVAAARRRAGHGQHGVAAARRASSTWTRSSSWWASRCARVFKADIAYVALLDRDDRHDRLPLTSTARRSSRGRSARASPAASSRPAKPLILNEDVGQRSRGAGRAHHRQARAVLPGRADPRATA